MNYKYLNLISLIENNDNYKIKGKLESTILYIRDKYGVEVKLNNSRVSLEEEVAQWKKGVLVIDIRKRGILGTLFIMSHVFGHLLQFSSNKDYTKVLSGKQGTLPLNLSDKYKKEYFEYEKEAFQIGKLLMMEVFKFDSYFDKLYTAFMYTDYEHYWNYLITGKASSIENFNEIWFKLVNSGLTEKVDPIFPEININRGKIDIISINIV